jgi:hypothetical protein
MIDREQLLSDLQRLVTRLEDDLRRRSEADATIAGRLKAQYEATKRAGRTAAAFGPWRDEVVTQSAVGWVLACVFTRFLEDNDFLDTPLLSGPGPRLALARDQHEAYFRSHPLHSDRDYLEHVLRSIATLPTLGALLGEKHNPLWASSPSGDMATEMLGFFQRVDPDSGRLAHDFTDPVADTRFLGDLYQDLSEAARKRYALLQTPDFVQAFILDRTLEPAIATFGLKGLRMIDPTVGSGHFLLGGFHRILERWQREEPGTPMRELAQRALDSVFGVDLNPFAIAIARFRLLLATLRACEIPKLRHAPAFRFNLATGDSLLHGARFDEKGRPYRSERQSMFDDGQEAFRDELKHHYEVEDAETLHRILGQQYHAVVGNPPYITVKDRAVSELYRARFLSCHRKYSLSVPFMERFFDLAVKGDGTPQQPAGFVGQITANSFMKREFGKKLIEEYLPRWDLTHVLDTAGAYIPGHGTPTVILFGKNQPPVSSSIRTVLGIQSEPSIPSEPADGFVWQAICRQIDHPGSESEWVSAGDSSRAKFHRHPWSIGGGGASELKELIDEAGEKLLSSLIVSSGFGSIVGEDEAFTFPLHSLPTIGLPLHVRRPFVEGDTIRDWAIIPDLECLFPYDANVHLLNEAPVIAFLWRLRSVLESRRDFSKRTYKECGRPFWEYHQLPVDRNKALKRIVFAFVASHNHFVFDSGGKVFKQSAPIINLPAQTPDETHIELVGLLNSSAACFWLKQVCHNKGRPGANIAGADEAHEHRFEFDSTKLGSFPVPLSQPTQLPTALVQTSTALQAQSPAATLASWSGPARDPLPTRLANARAQSTRLRRQLIAWQEELDWQIYEAFGLVPGATASGPAAVSLPEGEAMDRVAEFGLELGERAFEIVLARRMAAGEVQTTWFERHGSTPLTELPRHWPAAYRELVERRLRCIADDPAIRLIEQPEYKRRWNTEPWDEQLETACASWLLARMEGYFFEGQRVCELKDGFNPNSPGFAAATGPSLVSVTQLADVAARDAAFMAVAEVYTGSPGFSVPRLVRELVESGSVPILPVQRYKESGLRNRRVWEDVWELQRKEDAIDAQEGVDGSGLKSAEQMARQASAKARKARELGDIPVPPKYASKDFKSATCWSLRGKLDVPKERWVSFPGVEREGDPGLVIAWAGWNHLQQAQAVAAYLEDLKSAGATESKQLLLLAALSQLIPWLRQWHNDLDPALGVRLGDYFLSYLEDELRRLGRTATDLRVLGYGS